MEMKTASKIILRQSRGVFVESVNNLPALGEALSIRTLAYDCFSHMADSFDAYDVQLNSKLFLARNQQKSVIGSARCIDAYNGAIELDNYMDISSYPDIKDRDFFEVTRLSVAKNSLGFSAKMMLCKAILHHTISLGRKGLILWTKESYKKDYEYLLFKYFGMEAHFFHPKINNQKHTLMYMDIAAAKYEYEKKQHEFYNFFFLKNELDLNITL